MLDHSGNDNQKNGGVVPFSVIILATGFFAGYSKVAPGTAGSLVGVIIFLIPFFESPVLIIPAIVLTFFLGVYVSGRMEKIYGDDPSLVVIDEIVGTWISFAFLPKTITAISLSFLFFRLYDIFKPPPCRQMESIKGGFGIMLDDMMAGIYANVTVQILLYIFPAIGYL